MMEMIRLVKHYHEPLSEDHTYIDWVWDITVMDDYAYMVGEGGFQVIDVSTPTQPGVIGSLELRADGIDLAGKMAYVTGRYSGVVFAIDVFDPAHPRLVGQYSPEGIMGDAYFDDGILYVSGNSSGLWMLRGPLPAAHSLWLEAENAALTPPMAAATQAGACNNRYAASAAAWSNGEAAFTIDVPANANYFLWARAMGLAWDQNSFLVSVDGGPGFHYEIPQVGGQWAWGWSQVHPNLERTLPLGLTAGRHTLRFRAREANARLDAIYLSTHPHLRPGDVNSCQRPPTPTATPTLTRTPTATPTHTPALAQMWMPLLRR